METRSNDATTLEIEEFAYSSSSRKEFLDKERRSNDFSRKSTSNAGKYTKMDGRHGSGLSEFQTAPAETNGGLHGALKPSNKSSFVKDIDWALLWTKAKEWIKSPLNMALFIWIIAVGVSGAILFMVMTGMLNHALPSKSQRDTWFEVSNQILNALFTLMCLYMHPRRFHLLVLLCRWRPDDIEKLRKEFCKNGTCKPDERKHMAVVIFLLHLNCFAQYALCSLNLGYPRSKRPVVGVAITISVAICAPAAAGVYNMLSPLGRDYETGIGAADLESHGRGEGSSNSPQLQGKTRERRSLFVDRETGEVVTSPQWIGGLLIDFWDDLSLAYLSLFCSCCLFGRNMERLGFGNMYVHVFTFLLICFAPFFIFNLAAVNIDNEIVREALGLSGVLLCVFGLLYGGFWRIQMRKQYQLPTNNELCGKPDVADCMQWLCCCACSLAQEVRTADWYAIADNSGSSSHGGEPVGTTLSAPIPEVRPSVLRPSQISLQGSQNHHASGAAGAEATAKRPALAARLML